MIFDYLKKDFTFTLYRTYLFLFFSGAYSFLTYWIAMVYLKSPQFAVFFGGGLFLFVLLFHIAIKRLTTKKEINSEGTGNKVNAFLIVLISFVLFYVIGVWGMQWLSVKYLGISKSWFGYVGGVLDAIALIISFLISFLRGKETKKQIRDFELLKKKLAAKSERSRF